VSIQAGQTLQHYRLIDKIGEGGMGVVWRAQDTTLDREVAIKVLPEALAADSDRLARFEREAKLLASLEHPNIASVYGLHASASSEQAPRVHFLAMELVPGEDLAHRLVRGPMSVVDALGVARQVAEALDCAHGNGIIHRDLKPANILLTPDGKAKVLDFGLAKAFETDAAGGNTSPSMSPTLTSAGTMAGTILGTAAYMSPEQARGRVADKRSDIWSFGCVLFEMLAQGRIFDGETISDTLAAVLKSDPDWERLPSGLPRSAHRLLRRCLQKDPRQRLHAAADARIEIDDALAAPHDEHAVESTPSRSRPWLLPVVALLALVAGAAIAWSLRPQPDPPPTRRFVITGEDPAEQPGDPRISPDGRRIAFVAQRKLQIRDLDRVESRTIDGTDGVSEPFWSPDGRQVAYFADSKLWKVEIVGGDPTPICDVEDGGDAVWDVDDTITFLNGRTIHRVSARGGDAEVFFEAARSEITDFHGLDLLPDGRLVLTVHDTDQAMAIEIWTGDERKRVLEFSEAALNNARWAESGFILYARSRNNDGIWALPFSTSSGEATGEPFLVAADAARPSISRDGTLVHVVRDLAGGVQLSWITADGEIGPDIGQPQADMYIPALSPDAASVVVTGLEESEWDLWLHGVVRGTKTRLSFTDNIEGGATWSPDGTRVLFFHPVFVGTPSVYSVPADGREDPHKIVQGALQTLSADATQMVFQRDDEKSGSDLWTMPTDGGREAEIFLQTAADEGTPRLSPAGGLVAYRSDESGRNEIYIRPFPSGPGKWQVSLEGGNWPVWSRDGKRLYYEQGDAIHRVDLSTGTDREPSTAPSITCGRVEGSRSGPQTGKSASLWCASSSVRTRKRTRAASSSSKTGWVSSSSSADPLHHGFSSSTNSTLSVNS